MDGAIEERLVSTLEAVGAALPRAEIFARFSDDIEDEEALAKCLGRLVASGRLLRTSRERPGAGEEFIYSVPGARPSRVEVIAAAAQKRADGCTPAPTQLHEEISVNKADDSAKLIDQLKKKSTWIGPADLGRQCGISRARAGGMLRDLAAAKKVQVRGASRSLRYAALGVSDTTPASAAVEASTPPKRGDSTARGKRAAAANLAHYGAPQASPREKASPIAEDIHCAIEDTGMFAINDNVSTIRLKPSQIREVIRFLELTQHVWQDAA